MEEKDKIIVKWAQEDVETSNSLLNYNNNNNKYLLFILILPYIVLRYKKSNSSDTSTKLLCSSTHAHSEHHPSHVSTPYNKSCH